MDAFVENYLEDIGAPFITPFSLWENPNDSESRDSITFVNATTAIGIGGDPIIGTTMKDCLKLFQADKETEGIVIIGEIGGQMEIEAAHWAKDNVSKPIVGFIAGQTAPPGRRMGHAGAIVSGGDDTAEAKMRILSKCGISVSKSVAEIGELMKKKMI